MKSRSCWLTISHSCFALHYRLAPTLLCAIFVIWLCTSADALKLRYSGAEGRECVSEQIAVPKSYVTGSFVSLPGAGIPSLIGGRASYNLEVGSQPGPGQHTAARSMFTVAQLAHCVHVTPTTFVAEAESWSCSCAGAEPSGPCHPFCRRRDGGQVQLQSALCRPVSILPVAVGTPRRAAEAWAQVRHICCIPAALKCGMLLLLDIIVSVRFTCSSQESWETSSCDFSVNSSETATSMHFALCRDVLWEVYTGHSIARLRGASPSEPLWKMLDAVGSDLADMKSLQQYFHNQEIRTQASA